MLTIKKEFLYVFRKPEEARKVGFIMNEIKIKVNGMVCGGCEKRVENALCSIEGVKNVKADHNTGNVTIEAEGNVDKELVREKIEDLDFEVIE